jgi:hypothetical protein
MGKTGDCSQVDTEHKNKRDPVTNGNIRGGRRVKVIVLQLLLHCSLRFGGLDLLRIGWPGVCS